MEIPLSMNAQGARHFYAANMPICLKINALKGENNRENVCVCRKIFVTLYSESTELCSEGNG